MTNRPSLFIREAFHPGRYSDTLSTNDSNTSLVGFPSESGRSRYVHGNAFTEQERTLAVSANSSPEQWIGETELLDRLVLRLEMCPNKSKNCLTVSRSKLWGLRNITASSA